MSWYRIAAANYPLARAKRVFLGEPENRWPRYVAFETDNKDTTPCAVNVVYYRDIDAGTECGDFFFESVEEALIWCREALEIPENEFQFFDPFVQLDE